MLKKACVSTTLEKNIQLRFFLQITNGRPLTIPCSGWLHPSIEFTKCVFVSLKFNNSDSAAKISDPDGVEHESEGLS